MCIRDRCCTKDWGQSREQLFKIFCRYGRCSAGSYWHWKYLKFFMITCWRNEIGHYLVVAMKFLSFCHCVCREQIGDKAVWSINKRTITTLKLKHAKNVKKIPCIRKMTRFFKKAILQRQIGKKTTYFGQSQSVSIWGAQRNKNDLLLTYKIVVHHCRVIWLYACVRRWLHHGAGVMCVTAIALQALLLVDESTRWEPLCKLSLLRNRKFDLISQSGWNTLASA